MMVCLRISMRALTFSAVKHFMFKGSVSCCMAAAALLAYAGPEGGAIVGGQGAISRSGATTTINQATDLLSIDWQSFDLGVDERVRYIQPNASSVALNRILSNHGSQIRGRVDATGHLIFLNTNGVIFTDTAVINAGGVLVSGLNLSTTDFMNGDLVFRGLDGHEGAVVNSGVINAASGGSVALIGKRVENQGLISAQLGRVSLAAGDEIVATFDDAGLLGVRVSEATLEADVGIDAAIIAGGDITAESGQVLLTASSSADIFSDAVNAGEFGRATSVVVDEDGSFTLGAGADVRIEGKIDVSGSQVAGEVVVLGQNIAHAGRISANAERGGGGDIELHAADDTALNSGEINASSGLANGGDIKLLGDRVGLFGESAVDVSGDSGGGQVLLGGDYRGENAAIRNSNHTIVSSDSVIAADAGSSGDGGRVIIWADGNTNFYGGLSATGGAFSGDGGFAEISGKENLAFAGDVDLSAASGLSGALLLDPRNITISENGSIVPGNLSFDNSPLSNVSFSVSSIEQLLDPNGDGTGGTASITLEAREDITIQDDISISENSDNSLTFRAGDDINVYANISIGSGTLTLETTDSCGATSCEGGGSSDIRFGAVNSTLGGNLTTNGGNIVIGSDDGDGLIRLRNNTPNFRNFIFSTGDTAAGNITFTDPVQALDVTGPNGLSLTAGTGSIEFNSAAGPNSNLNLRGLTITSASSATFGGTIFASADGISVTADTIQLNGDLYVESGTSAISLVGDVNLNNDISISHLGAGSLSIEGTLNSFATTPRNLTVTLAADQDIAIRGSIGNTNDLGEVSFTRSGAVTLGISEETGVVNVSSLLVENATSFISTGYGISTSRADSAGGDVSISTSGDILLGDIDTHGQGDNQAGGIVTLSGDSVTLGAITSSGGTADAAAGDIRIDIEGNLITTGIMEAVGRGTGTNGTFNVVGDDSVNIFTLQDGTTWLGGLFSLSGAGDADEFHLDAATTGSISGGDGADRFDVTVDGSAVISGGNGGDLFELHGSYAGQLLGQNNDDEFRFLEEGVLAAGGLVGGDGNDTFNAFNESNTWTSSGNSAGQLVNSGGTTTFTGVENLVGGGGVDNFIIGHNFTQVSGGAGVNTFRIDAAGISVAVIGGGDTDTLTAANGNDNEFLIDANAGNTLEDTIAFSDVENLSGGDQVDTFTFRNGGTVSGVVDGAGGLEDILTYSTAEGVTIEVTAAANANLNATNIETINANNHANSTILIASGNLDWEFNNDGDGEVSIDANADNIIDATIMFTDFANVTSGSGDDTFDYQDSAVIRGIIEGGSGEDTFTLSRSGSLTVELEASSANENINVSGVEEVIGNDDAGSILLLASGDNTWTFSDLLGSVDGVDDGSLVSEQVAGDTGDTIETLNITFTNFANVTGGIGSDVFEFTATGSVSGSINGGDGANSLEGRDLNSDWSITGQNAGFVTDTQTEPDVRYVNEFENIHNLSGGGGDDRFIVQDGAGISGIIDGGANNAGDTLDYSQQSQAVAVNLGATNNGASNIESFTGSNTAESTIVGPDSENTWTIDGVDSGTLNSAITFSNFDNVTGGDEIDSFTVLNDGTDTFGSISGLIDGGRGRDTVDYSDVVSPLDVELIADVNNVEQITGNNINARLLGDNAAHTWNITGANDGNIDDAITFIDFFSLVGGDGDDTFDFADGGTLTGIINGGGQVDQDLLSYADIATPRSVQIERDFSNIEQVTGNNGTLIAASGNNTWTINGNNAGNINGSIVFSSFANLTGNTGDDDFVFTATGALSGLIDGAGHAAEDTVSYAQVSGAVLVTQGVDFVNVEQLTGNNSNSTLTADDTDHLWTINGENDGTVAGLFNFVNFNRLVGGDGDDDFVLTSTGSVTGRIDGGDHTDTDTIDYEAVSGPVRVTLGVDVTNVEELRGNGTASTLVGDNGNHVWVIDADHGGNIDNSDMVFTGFNHLIGGGDNDTFSFNVSGGIDTLDGGEGINTLTGRNSDNNWEVSSSNSGRVIDVADPDATVQYIDSFLNIQNITGQSGSDVFSIGESGAITGTITGGAGSGVDQVNYSARTNEVVVDLGGENSRLVAIEGFIGNGANSTIQGPDEDNSWIISSSNSGSVGGVLFEAFHHVTGGSADDTFTFSDGASIAGLVNGGDNNDGDALDVSAFTTAVTIELGTESGVTNIELFTGNGALTTLAGENIDTRWDITGVNTGTINTTTTTRFTDIGSITGGTSDDTFVFAAAGSLDGTVTAGDATDQDIVDLSGLVMVSENVGSTIYGVTGVEQVIGNDSNSTLNAAGVNEWTIDQGNDGSVGGLNFFNFNHLVGGEGADTFTFTETGSISGSINGGEGVAEDSANFSRVSGVVSVSLDTAPSSSDTNLLNMERITGNGANSTLVGANTVNRWSVTNENDGSVNGLVFFDFANLDGGTNDDTFEISAAGSVTGVIDAGEESLRDIVDFSQRSDALSITIGSVGVVDAELIIGNNNLESRLTGANTANTWNITGTNQGSINRGSASEVAFESFVNLTGGTGDDDFIFDAAGVIEGLVDGGTQADQDTASYASVVNPALEIGVNFTNLEEVTGNATAEIRGQDVDTIWAIDGVNRFSVDDTRFIDFPNIVGGAQNDSFVFTGTGSISGAANGGSQSTEDVVDLTDSEFTSVNLNDGNILGVTNVERVIGNNTSTVLVGPNATTQWNIDGQNSGSVTGGLFSALQFANFANLTGGTGDDTFEFTATGEITGIVDAGAATTRDSVDLSSLSQVNITLGAGFNGVINAESIVGNNTNSTLTGQDIDNTWNITGINDGNVGAISFVDFNHLVGGPSDDSFIFTSGSAITGTVNGGAGSDLANLSALANPDVNLGVNYISIESFINDGTGVFSAANASGVWRITGENAGTFTQNGSTISFAGYNNLSAGTGDDTFIFESSISGRFNGTIDAGDGTDTVDLRAQERVDITWNDLYGVTNAERVIGNNTDSTFRATDSVNAWTIDGSNTGAVASIRFVSFNNVVGGTDADTFTFSNGASISGLIDGGEGNSDAIVYQFAADVTLGTDVQNVESLSAVAGTLRGADVANSWTINGSNAGSVGAVTFTGFSDLFGGSNDDTFVLTPAGAISSIDAGAQSVGGRDTVNLAQLASVDITLDSDFNGVSNAERIIGNGANSTLRSDSSAAVIWEITNVNSGEVSGITFEQFANVVGGSGSDTFTFTGNGAINGLINGRAGNDTADFSGVSSPVSVDITDDLEAIELVIGNANSSLLSSDTVNSWIIDGVDEGTLNGVLRFRGFSNLTGGDNTDSFTISGGTISGVVRGGGDTDTLNADALDNVWLVTGMEAGEVTGINSFTEMEILNGNSRVDSVSVTADFAGEINTGGGNDLVTLNARVQALNTDAGSDQITIDQSGLTNTTINGGAGTDTLEITHGAANLWELDGSNRVGEVNFSGIELAIGNENTDTVELSANFGEIRTGGGNDNVSILVDEITVDLVDLGAGDNDVIDVDHDESSSWVIATASTVDNVSFTGAETVRGNDGNDTVQVNAEIATIETFGGADTINLAANVDDLDTGNGADRITVASATISANISAGDGGGNNNDELIGPARIGSESNEWLVNGTAGTLNTTVVFSGVEQVSGNTGRDNFVVGSTGVIAIRGIAESLGDDTAQNYLRLDDAVQSGTEILWEITRDNGGTISTVVSEYYDIENITGRSTSQENFRFTGEFTQSGLIDGGDAAAGDDSVRDTLSVAAFSSGVVVEIGPDAGAVSEGIETKPTNVVNAYNIESITAGDGTDIEEANNWVAITHNNGVEWFYTPNTNSSSCTTGLNQGCIYELDSNNVRIANSAVEVFNFGSLLGGSGDESPINVIDSGSDRTITGQYFEGSGLRNPFFSGAGFYVVDVNDRLGSVRGSDGAVVLIRLTDDTPFYLANNEWLIRDGETALGNFTSSADTDFSFTFSGVSQFQGGEGNDTFLIDAATPLNQGAINGGGGAGVDTITLSATTPGLTFGLSQPVDTPVLVTGSYPSSGIADAYPLVRRGQNDVIELAGIESFTAAEASEISLLGGASGDFTWNIGVTVADGAGTLIVDSVASAAGENMRFSGVDTIVGDEGNDTFVLYDLGRVAAAIDGGSGSDEVDLSNIESSLTVSVNPVFTDGVDLQLSNVEQLTTSVNDNTLVGGASSNRFTLTSVNDGSVAYDNGANDGVLVYTNVSHLIGGGGSDEFTIVDIADDDGEVTAWGSITGGGLNDRISVTAEAGLHFQVSDVNDNRADDTHVDRLNIAGIETVSANLSHVNTLTARQDSANNWAIAATNTLETLADGSALVFSGIQNINGGSLQDQFVLDGATISGQIDGGASDALQLDTLAIQNASNLNVQLGRLVNDNVNVVGVEVLTSDGANNTLVGANAGNVWSISGSGLSQISSDGGAVITSFSGFENLTGGAMGDAFVFAANVDLANFNVIDGGVSDVSNRDQVDLSSLGAASTVSLDANYSGADLYLAGIELLVASTAVNDASPRNTLVASTGNNSWTISDVDSGSVNTTEFVGFANLVGRSGDDVFAFDDDGSVSGFIDGGDHVIGDQVDLSEVDEVRVLIGDSDQGFLNIEQFRGNNRNSIITAADAVNFWTLSSGTNQGVISDAVGNQLLEFIGFNILEGGNARDSFVLNGGAVDGEIRAGLGNDELIANIVPGTSGDLVFDGGQGDDQIDISGGSASTITTYGFDADGNAGLEYSTAGVAGSYSINYTEVEQVNDGSLSNLLVIGNRLNVADTFLFENNAFTLTGYAEVNYDNKNSVTLRGENTDIVNIAGQIAVDESLEFANVQINALGNDAEVEAVNLVLNSTARVGTAENRLTTNIDNLSLNNASVAVYIAEESGLNFAVSSDSTALIDIIVDDDVSSTGAISASGDLFLQSVNGNINLSEANNISGVVALQSPGDIVFNNSAATRLGDVSAQNFSLNAGGNVAASGVLTIAGTTTLDAGDDAIEFMNAANDFNTVNLINAGSFRVTDQNDIRVQGNAGQLFMVEAEDAIVVANTIAANNIALNAGGGLSIVSDLNALNSVVASASAILINGDLRVSDNTLNDAVDLNAGAGLLEIASGSIDTSNASNNNAGDVTIRAGEFIQQQNADMTVGDLSLITNGNITQNAVINAEGDVTFNSSTGDFFMSELARLSGFDVVIAPVNDVALGEVVANNLTVNGTAIRQFGDVTASGGVNLTSEALLEQTMSSTLTAVGNVTLIGGDVTLAGTTQALGAIVDVQSSTGSVEISGEVSATTIEVESVADIAMAGGGSLSGVDLVDLRAEANIGVAQISTSNSDAGLVNIFSTNGQISDNNADEELRDVTTFELSMMANTGIGTSSNPLDIGVSLLSASNNSRAVSLVNDRELGVNLIANNGDITLVNQQGSVTLLNDGTPSFDVNADTAQLQNGVINANIDAGNVFLLVSNGDALASGVFSSAEPDIAGGSIVVSTPRGSIGQFGRPLVLYYRNEATFVGLVSNNPRLAFGSPRDRFENNSDLTLDFSALSQASGDLVIEVESLEEVDPAIFTDVRNYAYENISILMPRDQRFEDEIEGDREDEEESLSYSTPY